jgi:hypothetical protein
MMMIRLVDERNSETNACKVYLEQRELEVEIEKLRIRFAELSLGDSHKTKKRKLDQIDDRSCKRYKVTPSQVSRKRKYEQIN